MASPSRASSLRLEVFRQMTDAMAAGENAKVTVAPQKYQVKDHSFSRAILSKAWADSAFCELTCKCCPKTIS